MKTHIIYVPGLGDGYDPIRRFLLGFWRIYNVDVQMIPSGWSGTEPYENKVHRIQEAIANACGHGKRVVLIGESAGGSLALNVYASEPEKVSKVLTLCGKNTGPEKVSPRYYRKNPAFREAMQEVESSILKLTKAQRGRFVSVYPLFDPTVPVAETFIPDCQKVRIWSVGHLASVFIALTLASPLVVRAAKY